MNWWTQLWTQLEAWWTSLQLQVPPPTWLLSVEPTAEVERATQEAADKAMAQFAGLVGVPVMGRG